MFDFNNRDMVIKKLKELQDMDIPKMTLQKLIETKSYAYLKSCIDRATESEIKTCNEHLALYCEQGYNANKDIFSNEECFFHFGLTHGEMITNDNGMNRTYYHYLELDGKKHKVEMLLQYHPSCYRIE